MWEDGEMRLLVVYDVEADKIRNRVIDACKDYGLKRIQYSAFTGDLNHNLRQELEKRLRRIIDGNRAKVNILPVCDRDFRLMRELQYGEFGY